MEMSLSWNMHMIEITLVMVNQFAEGLTMREVAQCRLPYHIKTEGERERALF